MNGVCREVFRAIHEGKWLSIEYRNKDGKVTKYWIGIKNLDPKSKRMTVDGLHLVNFTIAELNIYIDSIQQAAMIDGSYCPVNQELVDDIMLHPEKYKGLFEQIPNLKILNYLSDCNRMDGTPYNCDYKLVQHFDEDSFVNGSCQLNDDQFGDIVKAFQYEANSKDGKTHLKQLGLNVISISCKEGLYILAYKRLRLDVKSKCMRADDKLTFNQEFSVDGQKLSIGHFMDIEDLDLLDEPGANIELIKDHITWNNPHISGINDMPYVFALGMDIPLDLESEYAGILDMYNEGKVTAPINAFFGDFLKRPVRRKQYPVALLNRKVNLD